MSAPGITTRHGRIAALAAALVVSVLLAGCGSSDSSSSDTTTSPSTTEASTTTAAAGPKTIEVEMVDYAFEGLPKSVPMGTKLSITNSSTKELHQLVALKLPDGEKRSADELVALGEDGLNALVPGAPAMVLLAKPGGDQIAALGDGTLTAAGRYLLVCTIPVGVDPDAYLARSQGGPPQPDPSDGPPHIMKGMYADLEVT